MPLVEQFNNCNFKWWVGLSTFANCRRLRFWELSSNPLNGVLPTSIKNISTSLQYIRLNDCKIRGSIPMKIGSLSNIIALGLALNELSGYIQKLYYLQRIAMVLNSIQRKMNCLSQAMGRKKSLTQFYLLSINAIFTCNFHSDMMLGIFWFCLNGCKCWLEYFCLAIQFSVLL